MRLGYCEVENFASYRRLSFDFSNKGLALVYGATGSGKSTLQDVPCWILFGETSKGGNADEVRSWQSEEATTGKLTIELQNGTIVVTRIRGKANENDLYWTEAGTPDKQERGKDLTETQKFLNARLGIDVDLYATAAYASEFSLTASFFVATAKQRRAVLEKIANLDLPAKLAERASNAKKELKKEIATAQTDYDRAIGRLDQLGRSYSKAVAQQDLWEQQKKQQVKYAESRCKGFEVEKASRIAAIKTKSDHYNAQKRVKLDTIVSKMENLKEKIKPVEYFANKIQELIRIEDELGLVRCDKCGAPTKLNERDDFVIKRLNVEKAASNNDFLIEKLNICAKELKSLDEEVNPYDEELATAEKEVNHFEEMLAEERAKKSPFQSQIAGYKQEIEQLTAENEKQKQLIATQQHKFTALDQLYDLSASLRGELLRKAVKEVEAETNRLLEAYFDAEIRVDFTVDEDSLDVAIQKSGNDCVYRQLSKGQRGLLKLCFMTAMMKSAANAAGVHFGLLCFDESLDGLDTDLKLKAFNLFAELETQHESVLVIDHAPELHNLFSKRYQVKLVSDNSEVECE